MANPPAAPTTSEQYRLTEAVDEVLRPYLRTLGVGIGTMDKIVVGVAARLYDYHEVRAEGRSTPAEESD